MTSVTERITYTESGNQMLKPTKKCLSYLIQIYFFKNFLTSSVRGRMTIPFVPSCLVYACAQLALLLEDIRLYKKKNKSML